MKLFRLIAPLLAALLLLSACGGGSSGKSEPVALDALYEEMTAVCPDVEFVPVPEGRLEKLFGLRSEDCRQAIVALCGESLRADELWLIEATDEEAAARAEELAAGRLEQRKAETENYLPDQYAVLCRAELIRQGRFVALIVSPSAKELASLFLEATGG